MQGGSRPQIPQGVGNVTGVSGQILHSQTSSGKCINIKIINYLIYIYKLNLVKV